MAESELHRQLVSGLASLVRQRRSGSWFLFADSNRDPSSQGCPPTLRSVCPDIYARENFVNYVVIGEAKTTRDLDNLHTQRQLIEYFTHLAGEESGS